MTIALVSQGPLANASGGANITPSFGQPTTAGNLLVAVVWSSSTSGETTAAAGWVQAGLVSGIAVFYKENCGAGETAPTFTGLGAVAAVYLTEWSGAPTSGAFSRATTGSGANPLVAAHAGIDNQAGWLSVAAFTITISKTATYTAAHAWLPTPGTVMGTDQSTGATKQAVGMAASFWRVTANNQFPQDTCTLTLSGGTATGGWVIVTFKAAVVVDVNVPVVSSQAVSRAGNW